MARPRAKQSAVMSREYKRTRLVQLLTLRENIDGLTAADLSRMTGLPEPECQPALERERLFRARRA